MKSCLSSCHGHWYRRRKTSEHNNIGRKKSSPSSSSSPPINAACSPLSFHQLGAIFTGVVIWFQFLLVHHSRQGPNWTQRDSRCLSYHPPPPSHRPFLPSLSFCFLVFSPQLIAITSSHVHGGVFAVSHSFFPFRLLFLPGALQSSSVFQLS
ncbi:uncharacterized protein BO97DRAFT_24480 [Aspergillus homomorphus CBS 101889]|uniref:Uncharacterized protein n=1 Tax=Aspergillus homomorphus (strain CBS 101889) TaxID=1450537 RepID=A0A395I0L9_ASPHC|nr:hypothetical protein BO97DRAFT_24480 [Aspergillus homomorphus CBS 101889]RAL13742.1 hypothetical protein BO97DRAFT_24480 [Aspergillus homomorphus CBS 101889]